jgi:acyl-CoA dehydrogenase
VQVLRHLTVFGYDDAPHGHAEVALQDVRIPCSSLLVAPGRGFEITQAGLGPGCVHHCMRSIGVAERALAMLCRRLEERTAFGARLSMHSVWHERITRARCLIDQARLLVLHTAQRMDAVGNRAARKEIAMIKVVVPASTLQVRLGNPGPRRRRRQRGLRPRTRGDRFI